MLKRANICSVQEMSSGVINAVAGEVNSTVLLQEVRVHKTEEEKKCIS